MFEEMSNYMNWGLSTQEALEWLMRQGLNLPDLNLRVMGIDELLQELRHLRQEAFQNYNLDRALEDIRAKLDQIVEREIKTARQELGWINPEFQRREEHLRSLPLKESEAIEHLDQYDRDPGFLDAEAKRLFDELKRQQETVRQLEQFIRRHGRQFQGPESLDYEQAVRMMNRFKQMSALAEALRSGDFREISLDEFREWLGGEQVQSILLISKFADKLEQSGYIQRTDDGIRLTPRGFRKIGQNALNEIFKNLNKDQLGMHAVPRKGHSRINPEETRPYEFGKPFNIDMLGTLKNAMRRGGLRGRRIELEAEDFEAYSEHHESQATTVMMLDMSWSMSRDGRFPAAKRVALALDHLIRTLYPRDYYYTIGFSTRARQLKPEQLPEASWDPSDPFTNLQEGLWLSRQLFRRHRTPNKQIIVITDGQPTATHINGYTNAQWPGFMGSIPPEIYRETIKEVLNCTQEKITINTFMLDDNPVLTKFVEEMTRMNRGRAFYSLPANLGNYLLVDYITRRRKQVR
jgi:uncharacterized protein with von Willebrand factor type A (vWA) domain